MSIKPDMVKKIITTLRNDLREGLVATDIWSSEDANSLLPDRDIKAPPRSIALINEVTRKLDKALNVADFPGIGSYYLVKLTGDNLLVVLAIDTYRQYILVDLSKTTMGILISMAIPNLLKSMEEVIEDTGISGFWGQFNTWSTKTLSKYPWRIR